MQITFEELHALSLPLVRKILPGWVATHMADEVLRPGVEAALLGFMAGIDDAALVGLIRKWLQGCGRLRREWP